MFSNKMLSVFPGEVPLSLNIGPTVNLIKVQ